MDDKALNSGSLAAGLKAGGTAFGAYDLIKTVVTTVVIVVVMIGLMRMGLPIVYGSIFIAIALFVLFATVLKFKRTLSLDLEPSASDAAERGVSLLNIGTDEKPLAAVSGIFWEGWTVGPWFGVGKIQHPENAMIVTPRNILLVYVPMAGGDKMVEGLNLGMAHWMFAAKEIKAKLEETLRSGGVAEMAKSHPTNFVIALGTVQSVRFRDFKQGITIRAADKKFSYAIRNREEYDGLKAVLAAYVR